MGTIPASIDVNVIPGVLGAGGVALSTIGLVLDNSTAIPINPIGTTLSFATADEVSDYFGPSSAQAALADVYFNGFTGRTAIPSALLFSQYPVWDVSAYLRGGPLTLTLAQLQALTGSLSAVIDGYTHVISSIDLSGYSTLSLMAAGISSAFSNPTEASFTASMGASFTGTTGATTTNLAISGVTGYLSIGDVVVGPGTTVPSGTTIASQISGTPGGAGTYNLSGITSCQVTGLTSTSALLDVTVCATPSIAVGQTLVNGSLSGSPIITAQISGTAGGVGFYSTKVNGAAVQQHVSSGAFTAAATAPVVTYSSLYDAFVITSGITGDQSLSAFATGTLASSLALTSATGAVLSQGAAATNANAFMDALTALNKDWVSFTTDFDPDAAFFTGTISTTTLTVDSVISGALAVGDIVSGPGVTAGTVITAGSGSSWTVSPSQTVSTVSNMMSWAPGGGHGNTEKLTFSAWNNSVPDQYLYAMWDTDITPTLNSPAAGSAGYIVTTELENEGTVPIYEPSDLNHAAFLMGTIASIDFSQTNGRTNLKFRTQGGLVPGVTDQTAATNLGSGTGQGPNGYNFVAAVATAADRFIYWRNGQISGKFSWIDSYINQIWLNSSMQLALLQLLTQVKSIPYNPVGFNLISGALTGGSAQPITLPPASPVAAAINFGAIRPNVPLSSTQAEAVNNAAGVKIDTILSTRGWYLQILPPSAAVRAARGTPVCNFWYMDGQSINTITLNSIEIE